ncbi:MAG: toll/interleukin-1 receptor domain-containing protein [Candidatus Cryptobacteroides sp.]
MAFDPREDRIDVGKARAVSFDMGDFVEQVFNDEYALVVGSEVMLDPEKVPDGDGDMNKYILCVINKLQHSDCSGFNDLMDKAGHNVDPVRNLLTAPDFISSMSVDDLAPELVSLLRLKLFKTVITTTSDSYMEMLLRSVWGDRLRVVNVADEKSLNEFRSAFREYRGKSVYNEPTLIYAFGKAVGSEAVPFARTDADYICFVERWMKFDSHSDALLTLVKEKRLLALGCKFEDWYFRFFWYVLRRDLGRMGRGQVAISLDPSDRSDANLDEFLRRYRVYNHSGEGPSRIDARGFMSMVSEALTSTEESSPFRQRILQRRRERGIFLSYYHGDEVLATKIFFMLSRRYPNVWFDTARLKVGDYNAEISSAIANAKIFIPILSPVIASHLENDDADHYYRTEWAMASQRMDSEVSGSGGIEILPVAVDGYSLFGKCHTEKFEHIIGCRNHGIDLMSPSGFNDLTEAIDLILGRI